MPVLDSVQFCGALISHIDRVLMKVGKQMEEPVDFGSGLKGETKVVGII